MKRGFSVCLRAVRYRTKCIHPTVEGEADPQDRFRRVPGTDLEAFSKAAIGQIGCGGLGSRASPTFVRKGIGRLTFADDDVVTLPNYGTQWFYEEDRYQNKAFALARNVQREATGITEIIAYPFTFQEVLTRGYDLRADVLVVLVDNDQTRRDAAVYGIEKRIPVVFAGVGLDGTHGYVFVQEPGQACFGCLFPDAVSTMQKPCPGTPTCCDILQALAALVTYAVDSLIMARPRVWNYRTCCLSGVVPDGARTISRRPGCALCGSSA